MDFLKKREAEFIFRLNLTLAMASIRVRPSTFSNNFWCPLTSHATETRLWQGVNFC